MAVADHIGHDKRGNVTYVRDRQGNEIVEEFEEQTKDYEDGKPVYKRQLTQRKVVDDNTIQIAQAFRKWLSSVSAASSSAPRGVLRCVDLCCPSTRQTRRSDTGIMSLI